MSFFFSSPPFARLAGNKPSTGFRSTAKGVMSDGIALVKAEIRLAMAEALEIVKSKARGAILIIIGLVFGWLAFQTAFILLGFVIAIWLQPWAAVLIVLAVQVLFMLIFAVAGKRFLEEDVTMANTQAQLAKTAEAMSETVAASKEALVNDSKQAVAVTKETIKDAAGQVASSFRKG